MLTRWLEVPEELAPLFSSVLRLLAISLPFKLLTSTLRGIPARVWDWINPQFLAW